jgi:uncharacterized protein YbgA (DUF1722 family)
MMDDDRRTQRCHDHWQELMRTKITLGALQAFYARYKYLIMSRHIASYHEIGALLANANKEDLPAVAQRLFELTMHALSQPVTRGGDANALLHISGYLKAQLSREEKHALLDAIEKYRCGEVEFAQPVALLQAHFERFPNTYIEQQLFLRP